MAFFWHVLESIAANNSDAFDVKHPQPTASGYFMNPAGTSSSGASSR
jgi:hypothetical protein